MGLHRKTAGILAFMMGATAILPAPYDTSVRSVYASTVPAPESMQKNTMKKATDANASRATPSNARKFIPRVPSEVPDWYNETFTREGTLFYTFISRNGDEQFRIYGTMSEEEKEETGWYSCSSSGVVEKDNLRIELEEEFVELAPYLYENALLSEKEWEILKKNLEDMVKSVDLKAGMGKNYDGSFYDVWKISTESGKERFFFYGHPVNTQPAVGDRWYECDEQGNVIAFFMMKKMSTRAASNISCTEKRVTREGDTVHICIKGFGFAQRPHLDGIMLFNDAQWECSANVANPDHWSTGHSYYAQSGSKSQVRLDFQYLIELGMYCENNSGENGVTYTKEKPSALIWDGSYKDGKPDYSSCERRVWAESVTWKGTYDYVADNIDGGNNTFEFEISVKNPIPQFTGIAMQLWDGDRRDSDEEGNGYGYESMGNFQITQEITSASGAAHSHTGDFVRVEPDCLKTGSLTGVCELCKEEVNEVLPALGHQAGNPVAEGGYTVTYCSRCHAELSRKANTYTVQLDANGGSVKTDTKTVTYQSVYGSLPIPERTSYRFDGWYTAAEGGTRVTEDSKYVTAGNQTLYAHWTKVEYTFQFDANGGTGGGSLTGTLGSAFGTLPSAERMGYTFLGWYTAKTGGSEITASSLVPEKNATYYAQWKKNMYTVTFDGNGGSGSTAVSREYMQELGTLPESKRLGYVFLGWFTQKNGGNKVTEKTKTPANPTTYYAQWKPVVYQIRYLGNGAESGSMADSSLTYDMAGTLSENQYQRTGYLFDGWKDGENHSYANQAEVRNLAAVQGAVVELHAQWKPIRYSFAFYPGSGDGEPMKWQECVYGKPVSLSANSYTKTGYHFLKWTLQEDGSGESFKDKQEILNYTTEHQAVISLYAQWEPNTYMVRFDSLGGICSVNEKAVVFDTKIGELPVPKKRNYKFLGWYDSIKKVNISEDMLYQEAQDMEVQAVWELDIKDKGDAIHIRPGEDGIFGTEDDEYYYNGPDQIAGTEDDVRVYSGDDGVYGTSDDFYYPSGMEDAVYAGLDKKFGTTDDYHDLKNYTNERFGADGEWGTGDEELWWNGPDGKPGTADDRYIEKGKDEEYGTTDDCIDLGDGTNLRSGEDLKWGTEDDITAFHGPDQKPGTADDFIKDETLGEHRRAGEDCIFDTEDDVYFWNGIDGVAGTEDDKVIYPGADGIYKTADDYYVEETFQAAVYRGQEETFGKADNYVDNQDGTNTRVGENGMYENGEKDDKKYLNGANGIPGDADDKLIERGEDGIYGTEDDYVDNGDGSNSRPGEDGVWGSEDDEHFTNGADGKPGTADDKEIHPGEDGAYGTEDDYVDNGDGSNSRPGEDGVWGSEDDEHFTNGADGKPGTADDKEIHPGEDGAYGTEDDYVDNEDGSNSRPGEDGVWGSEDDEHFTNGTDGKPGTADDKKNDSGNNEKPGNNNSGSGSSSGSSSSSSKKNFSSSGSSRNGILGQGKWIQDEKGWWYQFADGTYPKNSWQHLKYGEREDWYHFDENGYLQTGWFRDVDEYWYHLHTVSDGTLGHMETGWFQDTDGLWYYLNPVSDGHKGAMTVGWRQILDKWYYFNTVSNGTRGAMYAGTVTPDGYLVNEKGEWTGQRANYGKTVLSAAWKN